MSEKPLEESSLFQLKNGQYLLDPNQSKVFSTIMAEHPHNNPDYRWVEIAMADLFAKCYADNIVYMPRCETVVLL